MVFDTPHEGAFICLVTDELYPITYGGCGTLLSNSVCELLALGHRVLILADIPEAKLQNFRKLAPIPEAQQSSLELVSVSTALDLNPQVTAWPDRATPLRQSWRYWKALEWCLGKYDIRMVEFPDYKGWGYFAMANARQASCAARPLMAVRYHLPMEQIDAMTPSELLGESRFLQFQMERRCFSVADKLLFPSEAMARLAADFYPDDVTAEQVVVSSPSFAAWGLEPRQDAGPKGKQYALFYSRLAPQKGAELFIAAALRLLAQGRARDLQFVVAGPDMMQAPTGGSMSDYLLSLIPIRDRARFKFTGNLDRAALTGLLPSVLFSVFPTRSETYCYAAREVMMAGVPTIVSNIPAFEDLMDQDVAKSVGLTTDELFHGMVEFIEEPLIRERYEKPWQPPTALGSIYNMGCVSKDELPGPNIALTVLILAATFDGLNRDSAVFVAARRAAADQTLVAVPSKTGQSSVMGRLCRIYDCGTGAEVNDPEINPALCLLMQGDEVPEDYLVKSMEALHWDSSLVCAGGETVIGTEPAPIWDKVPWDAAPELLPFERPGFLVRCVVRGEPTRLSRRLLPQLSEYQEIHTIWNGRSNGGKLARMFGETIRIDENGEKFWRTSVDPRSSAIGLRMLVDRFDFGDGSLRVGKMLQCLARYEMQQVGEASFSGDVLEAVRRGYIPEVHGLRLNLSNTGKLLARRIAYIISIRPKSVVGTGQVAKAILKKLRSGI